MRKLLYAGSVCVGSLVVGFLGLLAVGPLVGQNESWVGLALGWFFQGIPVVIVGSVISLAAEARYGRAVGHGPRARVFLTNILLVAACSYVPVAMMVFAP